MKAKNTKHLIDAMVGKIRKEDDHLSNLSILNAHLEASDKELLELERLAEIGKATEKAYEKGFCLIIGEYDAHSDIIQGPFGLSIEGLLGLMEKEE